MACLNCGKDTPDDFATCSRDCAVQYASANPTPRPDIPTEDDGTLDASELAAALNVPKARIYYWTKHEKIPFDRTRGPRSTRFRLDAVRAALGHVDNAVCGSSPETPAGERRVVAKLVSDPSTTPSVDLVRSMMLHAAKEAARDVILRAADRAKSSGDHETRAQLLDDFIHMESGLQMIFSPRGAHA